MGSIDRARLARDDYFDSVLALDLRTGPDYDFAQGPTLYSIKPGHGHARRDVVGVGQKSGVYWAFDRDTGKMLWNTQVGPGGTLGGLQWGFAVDGTRVYTQTNNSAFGPPWTLKGGPQAGTTVASFTGFFSALDAVTGQILWQTRPDENGVSFLAACPERYHRA